MCIDIVEIWCGSANGQTSSVFDRVICVLYDSGGVLSFHIFIFKILFIFSQSGYLIQVVDTNTHSQ